MTAAKCPEAEAIRVPGHSACADDMVSFDHEGIFRAKTAHDDQMASCGCSGGQLTVYATRSVLLRTKLVCSAEVLEQ